MQKDELQNLIAVNSDFNDIAKIWRMSFSDSDAYINNFLDMMYKEGNALVSRVEGVAVAMLFLLESQLIIHGRPYSAYYLYAAATHPSYRNKGHMAKLINAATELSRMRGIDFIVLVPAEATLFDYYAKFGFETKFYKKVVHMDRSEVEKLAVEPDLKDAFSLNVFDTRQTALALNDFLNWGESALKYAMFEHKSCSGLVAFTSDGYAMYNVGKDTVYVKEMCTVSDPGEIFTMLLMEEEAEHFTLNLPVKDPLVSEGDEIVPVGMCLSLTENAKDAENRIENGYIGITLG